MSKDTRICSIDGCDRKHDARGWCKAHYGMWRRHGDPLYAPPAREKQKCSLEHCRADSQMAGFCNKHYARWKKHGAPNLTKRTIVKSPSQSFFSRTRKTGDCLVWTGSISGDGYGRFYIDGKDVSSHRYAWEKANGKIPEGMEVDHICHNPLCIKASHLRLATPQQNSFNRSGPESRNTQTGYRNVYRGKNKYYVSVKKDGIAHHFGSYSSLEDAVQIAAEARLALFGVFAGRG